jgi:hypothetical protein
MKQFPFDSDGGWGSAGNLLYGLLQNANTNGQFIKDLDNQRALQQYANVVSGQNIPAFAKKEMTPEQIQMGQLQALAALPVPQAQQLASAMAEAKIDTPERQIARGKLAVDRQRVTSGMELPATIQIANQIQQALKAGDYDRANLLQQVHKTFDRGVLPYGPDTTGAATPGNATVVPGYGAALGGIESNKAQGRAIGKEIGGKTADLKEREAMLPQLEDTVARLSELGKVATYTKSGQAVDSAMRQLGLPPRESAVARKGYVSLVDNQILPLLRQTFGAQFTEKEGNTLRATLGDPDISPPEKDAVLRSFIDQKKATIASRKRELGVAPGESSIPSGGNASPVDKLKQKYGLQ